MLSKPVLTTSEKVKLKTSIILGGIVVDRDKIIKRSRLRGTRYDDEQFFYTSDHPEFSTPAWNEMEELNVDLEERNPPPEQSVRVRHAMKHGRPR